MIFYITMSKNNYAEDIKNTVIDFLDDLDTVSSYDEKGDIILIKFFFERMDDVMVANHIINYVLPHSKKIKEKKESFFIKNANTIFGNLSDEKISKITRKLSLDESKGGLSNDDKNVIWKYFETLIVLGELYKKQK